jgi:hypothetical protein
MGGRDHGSRAGAISWKNRGRRTAKDRPARRKATPERTGYAVETSPTQELESAQRVGVILPKKSCCIDTASADGIVELIAVQKRLDEDLDVIPSGLPS